jgi:hypothetical protein
LQGRANGERYIDVLSAFLDESGTNPETPVLSVAGFYGSKDQWEEFRNLWKSKSNGFHAKNSSRLFPDLCAAIEVSKVKGMLVTVSKETYQVHASAHTKTAVGNPYSVCAFLCILAICKQVDNLPISFVLEQGQPNLSFVKRILEVMIDAGEWCSAAVASAKKSDFIELHAADFLSHIASSHDVAWMQRLFDAGRLMHGHVTEQLLKDTSPQITELINRARRARREAKNTRCRAGLIL